MRKTTFQTNISAWYLLHKRDLPWRKTSDPYIIWISEIILQQTRVNQGLPYFRKFIKNYPDVRALAEASEEEVLKDWEGLGYYSRARNLHSTAKDIANNRNAVFPKTYKELLKLRGVGSYTAAAISSFVHNEPQAVLDGNVYRVLARYLGMDTPVNTGKGKKEFESAARQMLDTSAPGDYNQAVMEFGALQCVPRNPDCEICPLKESCYALAHAKVNELPRKEKRNYKRDRYFNYAVISKGDSILIDQRLEKDIWSKLNQFVLLNDSYLLEKDAINEELSIFLNSDSSFTIGEIRDLKAHKLSHQTIYCRMVEVKIYDEANVKEKEGRRWLKREQLDEYAFPRPLREYLER